MFKISQDNIDRHKLIIITLILAITMIECTQTIANKIGNIKGITVTGSSSKIVTSDSASLSFDISAKALNKNAAYKTISNQLPQVVAYLKEAGFSKDDIDIKPQNGYETYKYAPNGVMTNEVSHYNLSQNITVSSKDVQKIKTLSNDLAKLIDKGININVYEPQYFYSKLADDKVVLLKEASVDAKERASAMLKATNNRVGKINSVKMGVFQITPVDSNNVSDMGINDTTSIDKKITSVVNVVFEIK
ncbi:MAG: SIMPL domain-containing protein [Candidatus Gastranaerophilales bacterium]|nr:SIMPL domain-containing protein [Candidatus Gastranaerophilales bacterium]